MLIALAIAAFVAGVTGSWSPCGFSMLVSLAPRGPGRRERAKSVAGVAAFAPGALAGGIVTFGGLALLGRLVHTGGSEALLGLAAGLAALAALGEAGAVRVRPQVRRQVPESWRRVLPLPVAAFGYGVLLGLGWTTYVLTLAVWALFAASFALGDPGIGLAAGLAFGVGRALPVVLVAPVFDRPAGLRVAAAMAERPGVLRGLRALDGAALAACAAVLVPTAAARARAVDVAAPAFDPSAGTSDVVWQSSATRWTLVRGGKRRSFHGRDATVGGDRIAERVGGKVVLLDRATLRLVAAFHPAGAGKLAVSHSWLVWRVITRRGDRLWTVSLTQPGARPRRVSAVAAPAQLSRPALAGNRLVYSVAGRHGSSLRTVNLRTGRRLRLAHAVEAQYLNPSLAGNRLLYVRITHCAQALVLRRLGRHPFTRALLHAGPLALRDEGHERHYSPQGSEPTKCHPERPRAASVLWTTALTSRAAYVTAVRQGHGRILRVLR